jgi:hypothetical protein
MTKPWASEQNWLAQTQISPAQQTNPFFSIIESTFWETVDVRAVFVNLMPACERIWESFAAV